MDEETTKTTSEEPTPSFSMRDLDEETIAILLDDMIATGG